MDKNFSSKFKKFGNNIRRERLTLGISQEELALKARIERSYMGKIERGEGNPSLKRIFAIAKALKIPPHKLLLLS